MSDDRYESMVRCIAASLIDGVVELKDKTSHLSIILVTEVTLGISLGKMGRRMSYRS